MFCILDVKEREKRLFHKNPPYRAEKTVIPKTAVFEKLTVFSYSGKCDFYSVREHLKSFSKAVIFSENCALPENSGIFEFCSNELKANMLLNSLFPMLEGIGNKRRIKLTVADKTGAFSDCLERLVMLAGRVNIITDNSLRYGFASQEVYEKNGAVAVVSEWSNSVPDTDVFISLSSSGFSPMSIAIRNRVQGSYITLIGDRFSLPDSILGYKPENVDLYRFASALFTLSSLRMLGRMKFDSFTVNSRPVTLDSTVKMLDTLLNI